MSRFDEAQERDMVLFVGSFLPSQQVALGKLSKRLGKDLKACVLLDDTEPVAPKKTDPRVVELFCDFTSDQSIQKVLVPHKHRFLAVTCRAERNIPLLSKTLPHVPYLNAPTESSLQWATNKINMRNMLRSYDKSISPKYLVVHDAEKETIDRIVKNIGFPLVIKPAGLAASLLVTLCYHREELETALKKTVKKIDQIYKKKRGRGVPQVLVEEFMEGSMYSIDVYVNQRGVMYFMPLVYVRTGRSVGYDDFFGYMRITPVNIQPHKIEAARHVAAKAVEALNLRSTTCHIELMRTEHGWKVIELGPRMGGFRHDMYELSYGMDHSMNDMMIRIPKKPVLTKKVKGYTAVLQFYARTKGRLSALEGINKARKLESFSKISIKKKIGDMCDFARNGDDPVFDIILFNKNRSELLADIRRLEQAITIKIRKPKVIAAPTKET